MIRILLLCALSLSPACAFRKQMNAPLEAVTAHAAEGGKVECSQLVDGAVTRNSAWRRTNDCKCHEYSVIAGEDTACFDYLGKRYFPSSILAGVCKCQVLQSAGGKWPAAWPPEGDDQAQGPWPKRSILSGTKVLEGFTDKDKETRSPMFEQSPLIGSATIPAGPMKGKDVPFPHSIQDAEGIGFLGTCDAGEVKKIVPSPFLPVLTEDGRAVWATWKDVERVNFFGKVCQRQWIAFYVTHPDRTPPPVESPLQLIFGQFTEFLYYSYTEKMYDDCEEVVEIDRNFYGWDSVLAMHSYKRDTRGHLVWNVTSGGERVMDATVDMPYGFGPLSAYLPQLTKWGRMPGNPKQLHKFLHSRHLDFHWVSKPGVMPIYDSENLSPIIHSPFGFFDNPRYPTREAGNEWDSDDFFDSAYYDSDGPLGLKSPMEKTDTITFHGDWKRFDFQTGDFSLAFYTHHFRMQWNSPWTFVRIPNKSS